MFLCQSDIFLPCQNDLTRIYTDMIYTRIYTYKLDIIIQGNGIYMLAIAVI